MAKQPRGPDYRTFRFSNGTAWMRFISEHWSSVLVADSVVYYDGDVATPSWTVHAVRQSLERDVPASIKVRFTSSKDMWEFTNAFWDRIGPVIDHIGGAAGSMIGGKSPDTSYCSLDLLPPNEFAVAPQPVAQTLQTSIGASSTVRSSQVATSFTGDTLLDRVTAR